MPTFPVTLLCKVYMVTCTSRISFSIFYYGVEHLQNSMNQNQNQTRSLEMFFASSSVGALSESCPQTRRSARLKHAKIALTVGLTGVGMAETPTISSSSVQPLLVFLLGTLA